MLSAIAWIPKPLGGDSRQNHVLNPPCHGRPGTVHRPGGANSTVSEWGALHPGGESPARPTARRRGSFCRSSVKAQSADHQAGALRREIVLCLRRGWRRAETEFLGVDEALELAQAGGVAHFAEGLGLDLADAFAGDLEHLANFFQRAGVAIG